MKALLPAFLVLWPIASYAEWVPVSAEGCVADIFFPKPNEVATWSGTCNDGKIDGLGKLTSSNGTFLEGLFSNGHPVDAKGRVSGVNANGRRIALGVTFKGRQGEFYPWKKSEDEASRYAKQVAAAIRAHLVLVDKVDGNPLATVELKTHPSGQVASVKLVATSGVKAWDEAVVRASWKVESIPIDEDGTVPSSFELAFRPK